MAHMLDTKLLHGKKEEKKDTCRGGGGCCHFTFGLCRFDTRFRSLSFGLGLHAMLGFHFP